MRHLELWIVVLLAACGGGAPAATTHLTGPPIDERTAENDARGTVREIYGSLSRGKPDNLFSVLDDEMIAFGPRRADAFRTRTDALVALRTFVDPAAKKHAQVRSDRLAINVSPGGRSAWAFDVVDVAGTPVAMTAVLSSEDDFFRVTSLALATMPSSSKIRDEQKKTAIVPPGAAGPASIDSGARGAVERFRQGLADPQAWGADLLSRGDAIVVGPARGELARGKKEIKKLWQKRIDAQTRAATAGEITAGITADGQLAWVTAPVTRVDDTAEPLPLRVFTIFERRGDSWTMIALHEALAIDEPGAGTPFVRVEQPPPPPRAEPAPDDAKAEAKAGSKAGSKKGKKSKKKRRK